MNFRRFLLSALLAVLAIGLMNSELLLAGSELTAFANNKTFMKLPDEIYGENFVKTEGRNFGERTTFVSVTLLGLIKVIVGAIASLLAIVSAIKIVTNREDDSAVEGAKNTLLYSIIGFAFILMSTEIGRFLSLTDGGFFGDKADITKRFRIFDTQVGIIVTFMKYICGSIAILYMTRSGLRLIAGAQNEETIGKDKAQLGYSSLGLVLLVMSNNIVNNILYNVKNPFTDPTIDPAQGVAEIIGFTNFVVSFVSPILVLSIVAGGVMVAGSGFSEETAEKGKKILKLAIAGVIMIYGSFAIVSTVLSGSFNA